MGLADARMAPPPMPRMRVASARSAAQTASVSLQLVLGERLAKPGEDGLRRLRTDVAREHDLFHLLQDGRVDLFLALKERRETRDEPAARRGETLAEAGDVAASAGRRRRRRRGPSPPEQPLLRVPRVGPTAVAELARAAWRLSSAGSLGRRALSRSASADGRGRAVGAGPWSCAAPRPRTSRSTMTATTTSATTMATVVMGGFRRCPARARL